MITLKVDNIPNRAASEELKEIFSTYVYIYYIIVFDQTTPMCFGDNTFPFYYQFRLKRERERERENKNRAIVTPYF